jgi:hypothetical protein
MTVLTCGFNRSMQHPRGCASGGEGPLCKDPHGGESTHPLAARPDSISRPGKLHERLFHFRSCHWLDVGPKGRSGSASAVGVRGLQRGVATFVVGPGSAKSGPSQSVGERLLMGNESPIDARGPGQDWLLATFCTSPAHPVTRHHPAVVSSPRQRWPRRYMPRPPRLP